MKKKITKTSFVRGVSTELSARAVVELARAKGLTISEGYVHEIRSVARRKEKKQGSAKRVARRSMQREIVRSAAVVDRSADVELLKCVKSVGRQVGVEVMLVRCAVLVGLQRARELLARVESSVAQLAQP